MMPRRPSMSPSWKTFIILAARLVGSSGLPAAMSAASRASSSCCACAFSSWFSWNATSSAPIVMIVGIIAHDMASIVGAIANRPHTPVTSAPHIHAAHTAPHVLFGVHVVHFVRGDDHHQRRPHLRPRSVHERVAREREPVRHPLSGTHTPPARDRFVPGAHWVFVLRPLAPRRVPRVAFRPTAVALHAGNQRHSGGIGVDLGVRGRHG